MAHETVYTFAINIRGALNNFQLQKLDNQIPGIIAQLNGNDGTATLQSPEETRRLIGIAKNKIPGADSITAVSIQGWVDNKDISRLMLTAAPIATQIVRKAATRKPMAFSFAKASEIICEEQSSPTPEANALIKLFPVHTNEESYSARVMAIVYALINSDTPLKHKEIEAFLAINHVVAADREGKFTVPHIGRDTLEQAEKQGLIRHSKKWREPALFYELHNQGLANKLLPQAFRGKMPQAMNVAVAQPLMS